MTTVFRNVAPPPPEPLAARRERMRRLLTGADGATALLLSVLLSLVIAQFLFSTGFLLGDTPFWQRTDHDIAQYLAGFNAYVREPWQWPLLRLTSINAPEGTLITFLDGVPLYALLLKLWQHGPDTPFRNPFAAWIVICFALQGVGAWWICREAQLRSWLALGVMVVMLAVFAPLSFRINHISLMSQWLILMGLAIYLRGVRLERLASGAWVALLLVAFYLNTYLFTMVGLLFGAALLRQLTTGDGGARRHALLTALAAGGLLALSAGVLLLPMGGGGGGGEWGFGFYSMNLLSPFAGGRVLQFTNVYGTEGQGEGYAYMGVFVLAAAVWALQLRRRADPTFWRRHRALAAILVFMTCFAISNVVFLGTVELFRLNLPGSLMAIASAVRSSGRFIWPVGYALTAFTIITLYRYLPQRRAVAALLVLLCLHLWDLSPHRQRVSESVNVGVHPRLNTEQWNQFFGPQVKQLQVYPPFGCQRAVPTETLLPTMLYAVRQHMAVSTGYVARVKRPCDNYAQEISSHTTPASGFVFLKQDFPELEAVNKLFGATAPSCVAADFAWLCKRAIPDLTENKQ